MGHVAFKTFGVHTAEFVQFYVTMRASPLGDNHLLHHCRLLIKSHLGRAAE
jgi:hypothetical protein